MSKKIIMLLLIVVISISQPHQRKGVTASGRMQGGYQLNSQQELIELKNSAPFLQAQKFAREFWKTHKNEQLGQVVKVEQQVVSGVNFKIDFAAGADITEETVQIIVYIQPWTQTIKVIYVSPAITGITDAQGNIKQN